jgi:hypothetical protein
MSSTPVIKEIWINMDEDCGIFYRKYNTRYIVTGLDPDQDVRPQIGPTGSSTGCFPTPGTFPATMPDGRPLIDSPMRVTYLKLVSASCGKAIVDVGMESRIGTFDQSGTYLLDMSLTAAVEWVPSNFDINNQGLRNAFAKVRYLFPTKDKPFERIAQLSVPNRRKCITIVQSEPNASGSDPMTNSHFNKMNFVSFTNSTTFWGGAPRTWLCTAIESRWTGFYDKPWNVTYQFVYNPNQWTGVAYFEDQSLKLPMKDILPPANFDPGTESALPYGCKCFQIAGTSDFNALGLPNITAAG